MLRHMMLYHTNRFDDIQTRIEQGKALVSFLASSVSGDDSCYEMLLKQHLDFIKRSQDSYFFHEFLEDNNSPIYFHEFISRAKANGLQYLAEADFHTSFPSVFPEHVQEKIEDISRDSIEAEQFMDFLRNRSFRQTLLCHEVLAIERTLVASSLQGIRLASRAYPESNPVSFSPQEVEKFQTTEGSWVQTSSPATKAALLLLCRKWPAAMDFAALKHEVIHFLAHEQGLFRDEDMEEGWQENLAADLLHSFVSQAVELHTQEADYVDYVSLYPEASPLSAYQARHGLPIVNQRHETIFLEPLSKEVLKLMNGKRTLTEIGGCLNRMAERGLLQMERAENEAGSNKKLQHDVNEMVQECASFLARAGLLLC
jgi:methyltransferase-like protein